MKFEPDDFFYSDIGLRFLVYSGPEQVMDFYIDHFKTNCSIWTQESMAIMGHMYQLMFYETKVISQTKILSNPRDIFKMTGSFNDFWRWLNDSVWAQGSP